MLLFVFSFPSNGTTIFIAFKMYFAHLQFAHNIYKNGKIYIFDGFDRAVDSAAFCRLVNKAGFFYNNNQHTAMIQYSMLHCIIISDGHDTDTV